MRHYVRRRAYNFGSYLSDVRLGAATIRPNDMCYSIVLRGVLLPVSCTVLVAPTSYTVLVCQ